ncbi:MAG: isoaspartyl peptidase/L-asparaginase [Bacteroidetes bacterium]|nr:isoaspartyl peptidase/L-asparaginase [Bacteroidota bacterium]
MNKTGIAVHGGAGTIRKSSMTPEKEISYKDGLREALLKGWEVLNKHGSALDAVEKTVQTLEDNPLFNAGKGSVFTNEGRHSMDASIMDGKNLDAGCVSSVSNIKNPVLLARKIMDHSGFVFLSGKGAEEFARIHGLEFENDEYFFNEFRYQQYQKALKENKYQLDHSEDSPADISPDLTDEKKFGTVGAVALDSYGNLAACTSTGGMTNTKYGRIGDTPLIGAGTYANNNTCAVSCTGDGEFFIRTVAAFNVSSLMELKDLSIYDACNEIVHGKLKNIGGEGGLIAIDKKGNIVLSFNSEGMYRAYTKNGKDIEIKIYKD